MKSRRCSVVASIRKLDSQRVVLAMWFMLAVGGLGLVSCASEEAAERVRDAASGEQPIAVAADASTADAAAAGGGAADAAKPPTTATDPTFDPARPSYEVPVPAELAAYARYTIDSVQWRERSGERRLEYSLPADLVGVEQRIQFSGRASETSPWSLRGDKLGTAECEQTGDEVVCRETLSGLRVDVAAVEARVDAGELDPGRLDVARVFESDPIGILRFSASASK
jgi:hypothetical protein